MRVTEFQQRMVDEFGGVKADWIAHSHVLEGHGATAEELIERGVDPAQVWEGLCRDFDIPESRQLGLDRPSL